MKELCNKIMKLNPDLPFGTDYSTIALALFLQEEGMSANRAYSIVDYTRYLYRFYSDVKAAKENHYYKIINEIWHYQPEDIYEYAKSILKYVQENIGLVYVGNTEFSLVSCPDEIDKYEKVIQGVVQTLVAKYIGAEYKLYCSHICSEEIKGKIFDSNSRVFYRALENINYCFISDETNLTLLVAVELAEKVDFDVNNYLILCKEHADMYLNGSLIIKKNGYPYLNGKRLYQHLDIQTLRKVRKNLKEV